MTPRRLAPVVGLFLACVLPPSAVADRNHYTAEPGYSTHVQLVGSNGYRINVSVGNRHWVTIKVRDDKSLTQYSTRGAKLGRYGASAQFPGLGQIRFRFAANGRRHRVPPPPWCEGPAGRMLEGRIRGRIRFTGEEGYTRVTAHHAKAEVETWPKLRCRYLEPNGEERSRRWAATFSAFRERSPNVSFSAHRFARHLRPLSKRVMFRASTGSLRGPMQILRSVSVTADNSTFVVPDPEAAPENFTLALPPPFSGTAAFQRTPESVFTWEGDLSVEFPGVEPMSLTGPDFNTRYCALRGCINQESTSGEPLVQVVGLEASGNR